MSLGSGTNTQLTGPQIVTAFLKELHGYLYGAPDNSIDGTPKEIIDEVIRSTDRFSDCGEGCIHNLSRQLVMALKFKGGLHRMKCSWLGNGRIKIELI